MSNILQFSSRKKIQIVLDSLSIQQEEKSDDNTENIKRIAEEEYQRGFNDCKLALENEYKQKTESEFIVLQENNKSILQEINCQLEVFEKEIPRIVYNLSSVIAEKIILHEVENSSNIRELIEISIKKVFGASDISIKVNPKDFNILNGGFSNIKLFADENIERGGCLVETEIGNIDARVNSQLFELKKTIETALSEQE